ncbi:MAG: alpha-2-macroglobulin [Gammaproteobacteria bacterium]|nr:alpha-2-macroglobulin [Gammaproteobacteria bacterium]
MQNNPISRLLISIKSFLASLFGEISWHCPPWYLRLRNRMTQHPKQCIVSLLLLLGIVLAVCYGYHWYKSRPRPQWIVAHIVTPQATKIDKVLTPDVLAIDFGGEAEPVVAQSVAPLKMVNKDVKEGITMTPVVKGTWNWETDSHLVFTPTEDWPAGQKYTIHFAKTVFANPKKLGSFNYSFTTLPFQVTVTDYHFYQDPTDATLRQAVATLNFNYPVDANSLERKIVLADEALKDHQMNLAAKQYKFTLTYDEHKRTAYLHSESLPVTEVARYLDLKMDKGVKALFGPSKTTEEVTENLFIPDVNSYFKITKAAATIIRNEKDRPEQVLTIETTTGVQEGQLNKAIHVYLLPNAYPATAREEAKPDYEWKNPGEVSPAILALSTPVDLQPIPSESDFSTLHSYQFKAGAPRFIYIKIDKGVKSFGDFKLTNDYLAVVKVPEYPKEIGFMHKGALLALTGEKKLSMIIRGLPAVKFKIARVLPGDINQLITQTKGDFNNPHFINPNFNQNNISEIFSDIQTFDAEDPAKAQYTALDLGKYLASKANVDGPQGLFLLQAEGWDPDKQAAIDVKSSRLILMTDLGLLVKDNYDGSHDVYVQSITAGKPVLNVAVSVLGKNSLPILSKTTDASGHVSFPTLKDYTDEREPTVYLAGLGSDVAFIPFNNYERQLNFSRFDIGGVYTDQEVQSLTAYVFSDRGIYRPGDTTHIGMIVKQAYAAAQPAGLPLEATVVDPRGVTIKDQKFTLNASGYLSLDFATSAASPTGQYTVNLFIVKDNHASNLLGSTTVRVAEFLPDTMRITAHLSTESTTGWVSPAGLRADVGLWNLYGAAAANRRVGAKILLTPEAVKFKEFPNYTFIDPLLDPQKPPKVFTDTLDDAHTDDQGHAEFDLKLDRFEKASYQLTFFAEGFEADGGRSVSTKTSVLVSPLAYLIGYKADGDLTYIKQDAPRAVSFIAVNPQLKPEAHADLKLQLVSLHPVTTLVKKADGTYQYQSIVQSTVVNISPFTISDAGTSYTLPTDKIGDFALVVLNKENAELSRLKFTVVGASQQPLPKNAELSVKLNKAEFMPDEDIELQITAPYTGSGLITVERDKVYATQWFKADTTSSVQKIHLPKDFQGDGYVNVAFVRDWDSPEIFISPLSVSVTPFMVNHANHAITIDLDAPAVARPGEPLTINYKSDKPGKIIVFAVDEGVLQAGDYKTPDPLGFFFQKHALEVNTLQTLDQILPKFIADRELSAVGGDAGEPAALKTLNPFKRKTDLPVVYWSGIVDTDSTSRQLVYPVPDYFNGSLRIMAVAVAADAVGAATKTTEVRGNFVITPNVPTFVAPGDEFEMTASVANNVEGSGVDAPVSVKLETTPELEIRGEKQQSLKISYGKEQTVHFKVRALASLGSATITLTAENQNKKSQMTATLSVRPVSPYFTAMMSGYAKGGVQSLTVDRDLYPEYRDVEAAVSTNPLIMVVGLNRYLEKYPYGCTEQLTSEALPLLALADQPWFIKDTHALTNQVQLIIQMLGERQMSTGGFSYWPTEEMNDSNSFASVYALHFLTEARARGYNVPSEMLRSGMDYLKDLASQTVTDLDAARIQAYAIYVLTRNEIVTTNYLTNLQLYLDKDPAKAWHKDIISAYIASTYQLMKSSAEANRLIGYYQFDVSPTSVSSDFYDQDIANAQYLYLLSEHFPDRVAAVSDTLVPALVKALNSDGLNTTLSGYTSLAFSAYAQSYHLPSDNGLTISETTKNGKKETLVASDSVYQKLSLDESAKAVQFSAKNDVGYFYQLTQSGFDKKLPRTAVKKGLEVFREYRDLQGNTIVGPVLGAEIEVRIQLRALGASDISHIAVVDMLPGGFEVVRDSVKKDDSIEYADVREDRVVFFTTANTSSKEIVYHIKAINVGKYAVPPIFAGSMYDPAIVARSEGSEITIAGVP